MALIGAASPAQPAPWPIQLHTYTYHRAMCASSIKKISQ